MSYKFLLLLVMFSAEISYASYQLRSKFFSGQLNLSVQTFLSYQSMSKCFLGNLSRSTFCVFGFNSRWFKFKPSELSCTYFFKRYMLWDMTGSGLHSTFCLHGVCLWKDLLKSWKTLWVSRPSINVVFKKMLFSFSPTPNHQCSRKIYGKATLSGYLIK